MRRKENQKGLVFLESRATVMMTDDKSTGVITWSKEKREGKSKLSELDSSPIGSFQSLQSNQSSNEDEVLPHVPPVGETRLL